jgi:hypothetical protein
MDVSTAKNQVTSPDNVQRTKTGISKKGNPGIITPLPCTILTKYNSDLLMISLTGTSETTKEGTMITGTITEMNGSGMVGWTTDMTNAMRGGMRRGMVIMVGMVTDTERTMVMRGDTTEGHARPLKGEEGTLVLTQAADVTETREIVVVTESTILNTGETKGEATPGTDTALGAVPPPALPIPDDLKQYLALVSGRGSH